MSRARRVLQILLHVEDTPHRIALAFGIGICIAFFPVLGVHTAMALAIAFWFRLSRVAMLIGAYLNNPWTIAPMYTAGTLLGCLLLGVPPEGLAGLEWSGRGLLVGLQRYLWPFLLGNLAIGMLAGGVGYVLLRRVLERRRRREALGAAGA
jgi:uncharacterized protein (DUF2062 family)